MNFSTSRGTYFISLIASLMILASCNQPSSVEPPVQPNPNSPYAQELPEGVETSSDGSGNGAWQEEFPGGLDSEAVVGTPYAHIEGMWSRVFNWPLIAIHAALLPNGNIFSFGTAPKNNFGYLELEAFYHDVWNPSQGLGLQAHTSLPNSSETNIFCGGQTLLPDGRLLIAGGDLPFDAGTKLNAFKGVPDLNIYSYETGQLNRSPVQMTRGRWYPTLVNMADGDVTIVGGYDVNQQPTTEVELWEPQTGWKVVRTLDEFKPYFELNWSYPFAFLAPNGWIFFAQTQFAYLNPYKNIMRYAGTRPGATGMGFGSAVMYDEGKILILGGGTKSMARSSAEIIDINSDTPAWKRTNSMTFPRKYPDATLLADGQIFVSGGSSNGLNSMQSAVYHGEIWNPITEQWSLTSPAQRTRMYHSTALLMPDARVLILGGDRPEETANFNGEIFYPPYLFKKDGSGELAPRPLIKSVEDFSYAQTFSLSFARTTSVSKVSLIKLGSVTHSFNMSQRFLKLEFSQKGTRLTINSPTSPFIAPPGFYLLFIFDDQGVPSQAKIVSLK